MAAEKVFTTEEDLQNGLPEAIETFWQTGTFDSFQGVNDIKIEYAHFNSQTHDKCLVIVPGRSEGYLKYQELSFDLFNQGFDLYIIDHRGQGISERMLSDQYKGYVESFDFYSDDLNTFINQTVNTQCAKPTYILAHSMGGAITSRYLQRYPNNIKAAVLSSPMIGINGGGIPSWLGKTLINGGNLLSEWFANESWYFLGQNDGYKATNFEDNVLMQSENRYKIFIDAYNKNPNLQLGGVTFKWLAEAVQVNIDIFTDISTLKTPVLVMQSGADTVVDNEAQNDFCRELHQEQPQSCPNGKPVVIDKALHELFFEKDIYRQQALTTMLAWFEQH